MTEPEPLSLSEEEFTLLLSLARRYHREAKKCRKAKAYLAGVVMVGSALEASLLAMVYVRAAEISTWPQIPKKKKAIKPLLEWDLGTLLKAAEYAGWLPRKLSEDKRFDHDRAARGDYAKLIHVYRNLAHPGRHLEDLGKGRMTKGHIDYLLDILGYLGQHLAGVVFGASELEKPRNDECQDGPDGASTK